MKNTNTKEQILELLFKFPNREFHLREISKELKISPGAISKALSSLQKEKLITLEKNFLLKTKANLNSERFKQLKRTNNLKQIYLSRLSDYLTEQFPLSTIILFGSYSKGEDTEKSDIDIAIMDKEKKLNLEQFEKILDKKINIEFINIKSITQELKENIVNGITLSGHIQI